MAADIVSYCNKGKLLDIGTGPGWLLVKLYQKSPHLELMGLDISPGMVSRARENITKCGLSDVVRITEGNVSDLPFPDEEFDVVASTGALHHWKDHIAGLNNIYRVLKRGGNALLYDLVSDTPKEILKKAAHDFGKLKSFLLWLHAFEEPFYSYKDFPLLTENTLFETGTTRFVGVMCCLILQKK